MVYADFCGQEEAEYDPAARKTERDEITKLVDKINISALISRASALWEASLVPYYATFSIIDPHEAQIWGG